MQLTERQIELAAITTVPATLGSVAIELRLNGEITANKDRLTHVLSRVPGVVREMRSRLGERVRSGDVMAVIESRELAEAKAAYLAARERLSLAEAQFVREKRLFEKKISSEQEYLDAKRGFAEARIERRLAEQNLHALGLSTTEVGSLVNDPNETLSLFPVAAPFEGTVIEKHVTPGDHVDENLPLFRLANLDDVWVIADVYEPDIANVKMGQVATITVEAYPGKIFQGGVTWIADVLDEDTRTLEVRVEVDNGEGFLKPGMFARIALDVDARQDVLTVPPSALQAHDGETVVFVDEGGGCYERREVTVGVRSATAVEVLEGIEAGEKVVNSGSFVLKSELEREGFEAGHAH